jgi:hypothetical protein
MFNLFKHEAHLKITYKLIYHFSENTLRARGSVVVKALCYKPEGRGSIPGEVIFQIYIILIK